MDNTNKTSPAIWYSKSSSKKKKKKGQKKQEERKREKNLNATCFDQQKSTERNSDSVRQTKD